MKTIHAIRKALDELGTNAVCREIWSSAEKTLGRPIAKEEFFRALDRAMDEIKGRANGTDDQLPDSKEMDRAPIAIGTRVAISIDQGLQKAEGVVRETETDDSGTTYRVDVTSGDQCNEHRTADGELWVCQFEVKPLPA